MSKLTHIFFIFFLNNSAFTHTDFTHSGVVYSCTMKNFLSITDKGISKQNLHNFFLKIEKDKVSFGPGGFFHLGIYNCESDDLNCNFSDNLDFFYINHKLNKSMYFRNNFFYYTEAWFKITSISAYCNLDQP